MKFFQIAKDGGPDSPVTGFFVVEIKSLFSIVFLKFNKGAREAFHSHAFNAVTLWLRGTAIEHVLNPTRSVASRIWEAPTVKYTPRDLMHRIEAPENVYAFSIRGPWVNTWKEYLPTTNDTVLLTHGRKVVTA